MLNRLPRYVARIVIVSETILVLFAFSFPAHAQDTLTKIRIANSALSLTALPLVAAREWGLFREQGLQVEIVLMNPAISNPAIAAGETNYIAGVGPGSVAARPRHTTASMRKKVWTRSSTPIQRPSGNDQPRIRTL